MQGLTLRLVCNAVKMVRTRLMAAEAYEKAGVFFVSAERLEDAVVIAPKMVAGITSPRPNIACAIGKNQLPREPERASLSKGQS